jgi:CheY-like chemotaxis protein
MKQVLVVDDEPLIREVIADILRDEGYSVLLASGGRRMLKLLESEQPDLVILDIMMPEGDGREALKQMRAEPRLRDIPVVMITTGMASQRLIKDAAIFLEKPFDLDQLLDVVLTTIGPAS